MEQITQGAQADTLSATQGLTESISAFEMLSQAGGFEWPILGILVVGVTIMAVYMSQFWLEQRSASKLRKLHIEKDEFQHVINAIQTPGASVYHRVGQSIWRALVTGGSLVDSTAEVQAQLEVSRDSYQRINKLIVFLSGAAGGIGLLGTLVGIYVLFSAGTRSPEVIFGGIALAVVSTLLGIVASIIMELLEAVLHSWVSKKHAEVIAWADEISFYLVTNLSSQNLILNNEGHTDSSLGGHHSPATAESNGGRRHPND